MRERAAAREKRDPARPPASDHLVGGRAGDPRLRPDPRLRRRTEPRARERAHRARDGARAIGPLPQARRHALTHARALARSYARARDGSHPRARRRRRAREAITRAPWPLLTRAPGRARSLSIHGCAAALNRARESGSPRARTRACAHACARTRMNPCASTFSADGEGVAAEDPLPIAARTEPSTERARERIPLKTNFWIFRETGRSDRGGKREIQAS